MTDWSSLEQHLDDVDELAADAPDPWAGVDLGAPALTDEQVAFLTFDQPRVPRLSSRLSDVSGRSSGAEVVGNGGPGGGTGNSPGDS